MNNDIRNTIYSFTHNGDIVGEIVGFEEQTLKNSSDTVIQHPVTDENGVITLVDSTAMVALIRLQSGSTIRRLKEPWMFIGAKYHERKTPQGVLNIPF